VRVPLAQWLASWAPAQALWVALASASLRSISDGYG
jgi:hypothetical protein